LFFSEILNWVIPSVSAEEAYLPGHYLSVANLQFCQLRGGGFEGGTRLNVFEVGFGGGEAFVTDNFRDEI